MAAAIWDWPDSHIVRVTDGDTIVAEVTRDIGFHGTLKFLQKLRLNRINAKKANTAEGITATKFVSDETFAVPLHIQTVGPYKYRDEWMAEVILPDGRNLSDALVAAGAAVYWNGTGPRPDLKPFQS
jgi:endonuclease YncB( thermonuclease family)